MADFRYSLYIFPYRKLRADLGHADDIMQPALVTVEPDTRPGAEYQD